MKNWLLSAIVLCIIATTGRAQDSFTVRAQRYVQQYHQLAIREQLRSGIPASVTLAQGILETEAGLSELACMANNHFGIKCKADYAGEKFFHDDDAPKECFRMYKCADDSYRDHSDYLKRNPRYNPLFSLSPTDYAAWAICLKKCGYATNPQYAQRLIHLIEDFKLQQYTYWALDSAAPKTFLVNTAKPATDSPLVVKAENTIAPPDTAIHRLFSFTDTAKPAPAAVTTATVAPAAATAANTAPTAPPPSAAPVAITKNDTVAAIAKTDSPITKADIRYDSGKVFTLNGLQAVMAKKGDILLQYAIKYNIHYPKLLDFNDLPDAPLAADMPIYLEKKLSSGTHLKHTVKDDETLLTIAQAEGIQLKRLKTLNMLDEGEEPMVGTILELQNGATHKPGIRPLVMADTTISNTVKTRTGGIKEYVTIEHSKPGDTTIADTAPATVENSQAAVTTATQATTLPITTTTAAADTAAAPDALTALKGELDKVVYTDDSKLLPPPGAGKHYPITISVAPDGSTGDEGSEPTPQHKAAPKAHSKGGGSLYTVKKGDTIGAIADANGVSIKQIMRLNKVQARALRPGQKLRIR